MTKVMDMLRHYMDRNIDKYKGCMSPKSIQSAVKHLRTIQTEFSCWRNNRCLIMKEAEQRQWPTKYEQILVENMASKKVFYFSLADLYDTLLSINPFVWILFIICCQKMSVGWLCSKLHTNYDHILAQLGHYLGQYGHVRMLLWT